VIRIGDTVAYSDAPSVALGKVVRLIEDGVEGYVVLDSGWKYAARLEVCCGHLVAFQPAVDTAQIPPLLLRWTCTTCGWTNTCAAPGFAGDGRDHFPDGRTPCGPITAQRCSS
jgi:hypothetical protein